MSTTLDPRRREAARLAELDRLEAMRPEADRVLQELVDDAREVFGTEFCLVNLVTSDTQYFKAWSGDLPSELAEVKRNPGGPSMCRYVVEDERTLVVEDFSTTEQAKVRRLRMGPGVRFYAGTPLKTSGGHAIGSFCVLDGRPREFGDRDSATLRAFAKAVVGRLEALGAAAHEREAKESERRYRRNVFELANDAILIYGAETGLILDANRRACEMYGIPQETLVGKKIFELLSEPKEHSQELLDRGSHLGFETVHRRADGTHIHVSINSSVTEYGGQRAILSINRDVTGRRQAEKKIRRSEARNNAILDASPDLMFLLDRAGEFLDYKAAGNEARLYVPTEGIVGRKVGDLMPAEIAETALHLIGQALDTGELQVHTYRLSMQAGPRDFEARLVKSGTNEVLCIVRDVTERKRTEAALRLSEKRLAQAQRITHTGNWEHELGKNRTHWSDEMYRILGLTPLSLVPSYKTFMLFVHPDDRERVRGSIRGALHGDGPEDIEYRIVRPDGEVRFVHTQYEAAYDESGRPTKFFGTAQDITDRKRVEQKLREAEERYRTLVEQIPAVAYIDRADVPDAASYTSPRIEALLGYTPEEWLNGRLWLERLHPEDRDWVLEIDTRARAAEEPFCEEYRLIARDGRVVWVRDESTLLRDEAGLPLLWQGVLVDITERKRAEEELLKSAARSRAILDASPDSMFLYSRDGEYLDIQASEVGKLYLPRDGLIGRKLGDVLPTEVAQPLLQEIARALDTQETRIHEYRLEVPDGVLDFEAYLAAAGPDEVLCVARDVTERKRAEGRLREAEEKYRTLVEQIPAVTYIDSVDDPDTSLYTSPQIEELLGYSPEEWQNERLWSKRLHPEDRERVLAADERFESGGEPFHEEYRLLARDGSVVWVCEEAVLISNEAGEPLCRQGVAFDVTEQKEAEEALKQSEERYRNQSRELTLLHRVRTALAHELEPPDVFRTVVEAIAQTYGYTQVSAYRLQGETLELQHQVGYEQVLACIPITRGIMGRVTRTGQPALLEDVRYDPEFLGAIEGITSKVCVPLLDEDGIMGTLNIESTEGVALTEDDLHLMIALAEHMKVALGRARLHAQVRDSEERFRSLIQNASDIITLLEADGTIRYQSLSIARILGYQPEELIGKNAFEYIHPEDVERAVSAFAEGVEKPEIRPFVEYRFLHKDGSWRHLESIGSNLLDDPGVGKFVVNSRDITERKRGEEKLRVAEEKYRSLVETIPATTYVGELDEVSTSIYVSPQIESILGFTAEERMSTPDLWVERLHPEDRERVLAENDRSKATGDPLNTEYRIVDRDGRVVWVYDASVVLRDVEGRLSFRQGVMFDVTERRRMEEALRASEARLRTVIEQSPLSIHIFAPDGTSLLANGAWDRLWCLDDEESGQANIFEDEQLRNAGLIEHIERSVAEGDATIAPPLLFDPAEVGREGSPCWLRALIYPVRGEDGRVLETVLLLEDITERKRAEDALKESEKRYKAVVEQSAEAIWLFDPDTKRVLETNAAFQEMLGYDAEELRRMTNYDFVNHSREDVDRAVERKLRGEENPRAERKYRRKDGTLLDIEVGGTVISYGGKKMVCSVARDITERKQVEEEMREANRRLGELATLRADFTAMVAHELDTPLAVIRGYADVLATGELEPAEWERALSRIQAETEILNALVGDVRVAASAERKDFVVNPRRVPVGELLNDAVQFVATLSGDHPLVLDDAADAIKRDGVRASYADQFVFEDGADRREVWADRYRIGQVLRNLLTNAVKYSPEGAPIELRMVPDEAAGRVRIEVIDHGPGIHPNDVERIFEKFGRGRDPEGQKVAGLGLGLYLSRRILRAHGSDLTVDAVPGDGSVFGFDLEAADE